MKLRFFLLLLLSVLNTGLYAENLPSWLLPLREAVFEQRLKADEVRPLYLAAKAAAQANYSGSALDVALSRCEFFMGQVLLFDKRDKEALVHYDEGMVLAERAIKVSPSSEAWQLRAENLSRACSVRSIPYVMANGLKVGTYANNALSLNSRNAAAMYLVAARWVFAPSPFNDLKKGIEMMKAIPVNSNMGKDDSFNVYSAIGYAYLQQKNHDEAQLWLLRAQDIYPGNKYVAELLDKCKTR
jgi:tetratricopeptide (TPR) repeat protein